LPIQFIDHLGFAFFFFSLSALSDELWLSFCIALWLTILLIHAFSRYYNSHIHSLLFFTLPHSSGHHWFYEATINKAKWNGKRSELQVHYWSKTKSTRKNLNPMSTNFIKKHEPKQIVSKNGFNVLQQDEAMIFTLISQVTRDQPNFSFVLVIYFSSSSLRLLLFSLFCFFLLFSPFLFFVFPIFPFIRH